MHWRSSHYAVSHVRNKNNNSQGRSPNVAKVISMPLGTALKGNGMCKSTESMVLKLYLKPGETFKSLKSEVY